jgi:hypothetical protein
MEQTYSILSLELGRFEVTAQTFKDLQQQITDFTGILSLSQQYFSSGQRLYANSLEDFSEKDIQVIPDKRPVGRYFVQTPEEIMSVYIFEPSSSKIIDLLLKLKSDNTSLEVLDPKISYTFELDDQILSYNYPLSQIPLDTTLKYVPKTQTPANGPFQIYVKQLNSTTLELTVNKFLKTTDLKEEIFKKIGLIIDAQRLIYLGKQLDDDKFISFYDIDADSVLYLYERLRGGGGLSMLTFNDMRNQVKIGFSHRAPAWRTVEYGISWLAICNHHECVAYKREVICNAGFGVFDVKAESVRNRCPMCKLNVINLKNCGFLKAKWRFLGHMEDGVERRGNGEADDQEYTTFNSSEEEEWRDLLIEVEPFNV